MKIGRTLYCVIALALMMAVALPMATPVIAQTTTSLVMWLAVDPGATYPNGTLHYTVTLMNLDMPGARDSIVDIYFHLPGPTGAAGAYGPAIMLDAGRRIEVGETVTYNWSGDDGAVARPALAVDLGDIPLDPGATVVTAASEYDGEYVHDPSYGAYEIRRIPAGIIRPDTEVTIAASTDRVDAGGVVDLTITGKNTGDVPLTNVSVTLNDGTDEIAVLTAPPDSGDLEDEGVLDPGETWVWTITGVMVEGSTAYTATGHGEDSLGNAVTYPDYAGARASVTVDVTGPCIKLRKLVNGEDAGSPTGPVVEVGSTVTFDFVVTNAGQVELAPVVITDDVLGSIGTIESLSPGASQTLTVTASASAGQHSNLGTVTGTPPTGPDVSATAVAHYYGSATAPPTDSHPRSISGPALLAILVALGVAIAAGTVMFARRYRDSA